MWRVGAAALCLSAVAGCGLISRSNERAAEPDLPPAYTPALERLPIAEVSGINSQYDIYAVIPSQGPLAGGNPARLDGAFPNPTTPAELAAAEGAYTVYFGNNIAPYDTVVSPYIAADRIYVTVPPGDAPGLVDVIFRDTVTLLDAATLYDGYEYINTSFSLYNVSPGRGWIFGDEAASLQGIYPVTNAFSQSLLGNVAGASQYYRVYFDVLGGNGRLAAFDATVLDPVITAGNMYVRSPFGDDVELVDVTIVSHDNGDFSNSEIAQLRRAYKYYAMYLTRVIPNSGPVAGLNTARLEGFLPGLAIASNIYSAYARYAVYFGSNRANFVDLGPDPVFSPSTIVSMAARIYTTGRMYVEVPPGNGPGFVDVRIEDLESDPDLRDETTICPNCYEYTDPDGVGRWTDAEVVPNPVGKLPAGHLLVTITVTGEIDGDDNVFIVPHGGDPAVTAHRIPLDELSSGNVGGDWVWVGTNAEEIPRVLANGNLLVDGHAAVYLYDTENDEIVGDDTSELTDGGIIEGSALEGRHFIIDTIPPRMRLVPGLERLRGDDFVSGDIPGNWGVIADLDSAGPVVTPTFAHPFDMSALAGFPEVSFAGNWMERPRRVNSKAQVFFRASSLTNFFLESNYVNNEPSANLMFTLQVVFEDVDIYTAMGRDRTGVLNTNRFSGSTDRLVAGFPNGTTTLTGRRDNVLVANTAQPDLQIAWEFLPSGTQSPNIEGITVDYIPGTLVAAGGNPGLSTNLQAFPIELTGVYTIGDPGDPTSGVQVADTGARTLMPVVFRAVDRAGDYFPQGDPAQGRRKLYTANDTSGTDAYSAQPEVGPLHLWWLRSTATLVTSNVPTSGDSVSPEFSWTTTGAPDTDVVLDPLDGVGVQRLYSYAIYRTDGAGTRDEQRDGPYDTLVGSLFGPTGGGGPGQWSEWNPRATLNANEVRAITGGLDGVWYLLVVMSCDEAGNIEVWPEAQLEISANDGPSVIDFVNEGVGTQERNWERWFVAPVGRQVDTRVEPFFWHDQDQGTALPPPNFNGDRAFLSGEPSFGDAEVIPYPSIRFFNPNAGIRLERVMGEFRMTLTSESGPLGVLWTLFENGVEVFTNVEITPSQYLAIQGSLVLPPILTPDSGFLGSANRQPTYYTFQAQAYLDVNNNDLYDNGTDILDTSPATVQFVVVDNVAEFIQRRKSEDAQPIQEMDRPQ